ncbi:MAG: hypothetical protein RR293_07820 [Bacteroidales bacterium]
MEFISSIINKFFAVFRKSITQILICYCIVGIVFVSYPYYGTRDSHYDDIAKQMSVLMDLSEINLDKIQGDQYLINIYEKLKVATSQQADALLFPKFFTVKQSTDGMYIGWILKFICGGVMFFILEVINAIASKKNESGSYIVLAIISGLVNVFIPMFVDSTINYVFMPSVIMLAILSINKIYTEMRSI